MRLLLVLAVLLGGASSVTAVPWQPFTALAESADGRFLATGGREGEVLCWEVSTGEVLWRWQLVGRPVAGLAFDSVGVTLGAVLVDGVASLLSVADGTKGSLAPSAGTWSSLPASVIRWQNAPPMSGTLVRLGDRVARGSPDGRIVVTDLTGEVSWQAHGAAVTGLVWNAEGTILTSCAYDGSLARWDSRTGRLLARL